MNNYGLDTKREEQEQDGTEYILGAESPVCIAADLDKLPFEEIKKYLPAGEVQRSDIEDMQDCASRSPINILETKFKYLLDNHLVSEEDFNWLYKNGYIQTEQYKDVFFIEFSDAFVAINSGTTRRGNSMKAPIHAVHKKGLVPKSKLPLEKWMTWEDYHNPSRITKELEDLGMEFLRRFLINYYKGYDLNVKEMLCVGGYAWPQIVGGVYVRTDSPPNHAYVRVKPAHMIFDNYIDSVDGDFIKKLAPDYKFMPYGYRLTIGKGGAKKPSFFGAFGDVWNRIFRYNK